VSKKSLNVSTSEGNDLHTVFCFLQVRYGNIKHKAIEAILDRYLVSALKDDDPRLEFEINDRANNLEAAVKTMRSRIRQPEDREVAKIIEVDYSEQNLESIATKKTQSQQANRLEVREPGAAEREMVHKQELLDMGMRYE